MGSQTLALLTTKENLFWTKQTDLSHRSWSAATQCLLLHLPPIPPPVVLDRFEAFPGKQSPQGEAYQRQELLLQGSPLSSLLLLLLLLLVHCNSQILFDVVSRTVVVVAVTKQRNVSGCETTELFTYLFLVFLYTSATIMIRKRIPRNPPIIIAKIFISSPVLPVIIKNIPLYNSFLKPFFSKASHLSKFSHDWQTNSFFLCTFTWIVANMFKNSLHSVCQQYVSNVK